ncbi:MAG: hypothetical protein FWD58_02355 [Firmicutes bacterium]|nr:hypothetical protein [Bacillota bacterium]
MNKGFYIYIAVILCGWAAIITLNCILTHIWPWLIAVGVIGSTVVVIAIDAVCAHICHVRQSRIDPFSRFFNVSKRQKNVLTRLGIRKLKNYLPDLGVLVKFPKGRIVDPKSKEYVRTYMMESCSGEIGHIFGAFFGFLILLIFPPWIPLFAGYWLSLTLPVALVNFVLCLLPPLALRYNRYSLAQIYLRLEAREKRNTVVSDQ